MKRITGTSERPRLSVHRGKKNLYVQLIDDTRSATIVSASTFEKSFREKNPKGGNKKAAAMLGEIISARAREKGIERIVFDRGGYKYHGRIKELAEAMRKAKLEF